MSPDQLLAWIPAPILAGMLYIFIKREFARTDTRWERVEKMLNEQHMLATKDALTNMGNRFAEQLTGERKSLDEKIADLRERVRVLESKQ